MHPLKSSLFAWNVTKTGTLNSWKVGFGMSDLFREAIKTSKQ